jgi:hypothetical protein
MKDKKWINCDNRKTSICPHNETDVMKSMTDVLPKYHGGKIPPDMNNYEEADKICAKCDSFKFI